MTDVITKLTIKGKNYETLVDLDKALKFRKGEGSSDGILVIGNIFHDSKKGLHVSEKDLKEAFGTNDIQKAVEKIVKQGEINIPKDHRDKEREDKKKQVVNFLTRFAIDPRTDIPHTAAIIEGALDEAGVNIDNRPVEQQISKILEKIRTILPIKIQSKKLKLRIPAEHTGRAYGLVNEYKESENWLSNGDLEVIINLPVGLQDDFYDKLNSFTHGSTTSQEIKEKIK
mgnify:CR=1 FL=1